MLFIFHLGCSAKFNCVLLCPITNVSRTFPPPSLTAKFLG